MAKVIIASAICFLLTCVYMGKSHVVLFLKFN